MKSEDIQDFYHDCAVAKIPRVDDYGDGVSNDMEMDENVIRLKRSFAEQCVEENNELKRAKFVNEGGKQKIIFSLFECDEQQDVRSDCSRFAVDKPVEANDYGCGMSDDNEMEQSNKSLESEEKMATECTAVEGESDSDDFADVDYPSDEKLYWWCDSPEPESPVSRNYSTDSDIVRHECQLPGNPMIVQTDDESNDGFWEQGTP